jgi:EVE domain
VDDRRYYINLFTPETWAEAAAVDFAVTGFTARRRNYAKRIHPGDIFLCYLTGKSRFVGALEVESDVYIDDTPIWRSQPFPTRFRCKLLVEVPADAGPHLREVQQRSANPGTYDWIFRGSPQEMPGDDSEWIISRLEEISATGVKPRRVRLEVGPEEPLPETPDIQEAPDDASPEQTVRDHTRIQWRLATLGRKMKLDIWIARNDKHLEFNGDRLGDLSVDALPVTFDRTTQGTVERIDVLWLKRNRIEAAFEIESTTAIYSGLLRMSDLLAMQPNIDIPLFLVAPDERRHLVEREILRPTFTRLETPLHKVCRYISFTGLEGALDRIGDAVEYMRPDFLDSIAETVSDVARA